MNDEPLVCWHCGSSIAELPFPLAREAECRSCRAQLHVCRLCQHYAAQRGGCLEARVEPPADATRANFCDLFTPKAGAFQGAAAATAKARSALEALFGGGGEAADPPEAADATRSALEALFKR